MKQNVPVYDRIGKTYDVTRRADPSIVEQLYHYLSPTPMARYLDIGCGSGNYTLALAAKGLAMTGVDISTQMLVKAKTKTTAINWFLGNARQLPFLDNAFQGATCILATHHMTQLEEVFKEVRRVLANGRFIIFTSTPEQMNHYWLFHYFPSIKICREKMLNFADLRGMLANVGFDNIQAKPFFVTNELQDLFLNAGKYRPEIYLDPLVRAGMSGFAQYCHGEEETEGLKALSNDIQSGIINQIIKAHESNLGDYLFVTADFRV